MQERMLLGGVSVRFPPGIIITPAQNENFDFDFDFDFDFFQICDKYILSTAGATVVPISVGMDCMCARMWGIRQTSRMSVSAAVAKV